MRIVILGCGRVGADLAARFSQSGHEVSIIDRSRDAFSRLGHEFAGRKVVGVGTNEDVLRSAGLEGADAFVAVAYGDNTNVMASQIAERKFGVPRVLCRMKDPSRARAYREMGLNTFPSTLLGAGVTRDFVLGTPWKSVEQYLDLPASSEDGS